jgi:phosphoribosylformylglycinamidine synthase subunit PurS
MVLPPTLAEFAPPFLTLGVGTKHFYITAMKAKVIVTAKAAVLDPQGAAVRDAMRHLGMDEVRSVRIGKYLEIELERDGADTKERLEKLCGDLLSNPVIEDYQLLAE